MRCMPSIGVRVKRGDSGLLFEKKKKKNTTILDSKHVVGGRQSAREPSVGEPRLWDGV